MVGAWHVAWVVVVVVVSVDMHLHPPHPPGFIQSTLQKVVIEIVKLNKKSSNRLRLILAVIFHFNYT